MPDLGIRRVYCKLEQDVTLVLLFLPEVNAMKIVPFLALGLLAAALMTAQTGNRKATDNAQSPSAEASTTLANGKVTIEYNAPSARGRKVEGGLVPYDNWWRLGADNATTLTNSGDIMIGDLRVPKGAHTLYIQASENGWKLIVNKQTGQWGTVYKSSEDLGRVDMKTTKLASPVEKLKITLSGSGSSGMLTVEWGNTKAAVPIKVS